MLEDCCRQSRTTWSKSLGPSTLNCLYIWGKETIMLWQTHIAIRTLNKILLEAVPYQVWRGCLISIWSTPQRSVHWWFYHLRLSWSATVQLQLKQIRSKHIICVQIMSETSIIVHTWSALRSIPAILMHIWDKKNTLNCISQQVYLRFTLIYWLKLASNISYLLISSQTKYFMILTPDISNTSRIGSPYQCPLICLI